MTTSTKPKLLSYAEIRARGVPWSRPQLAKLESAGRFPRRVDFGPKTKRWLEHEVDQYLADRTAQREKGASSEPVGQQHAA